VKLNLCWSKDFFQENEPTVQSPSAKRAKMFDSQSVSETQSKLESSNVRTKNVLEDISNFRTQESSSQLPYPIRIPRMGERKIYRRIPGEVISLIYCLKFCVLSLKITQQYFFLQI